jgi:hypothetical protein
MPAGNGHNDARGVWQYGENDADALFSDLLNRGQSSVSAAIAADRTRLGNLEAIRPGTRKIKPASVVVNAGAQVIGADGTVRLSGAVNKVSLVGLFGGSYENYKITLRVKSSAAELMAMQLRAGGADAVAANYAYQGFGMSGAAASGGAAPAAAQWAAGNAVGTDHVITIHLFGPALAAATIMETDYYTINGATRTIGRMGGDHSLATAYDGLTLSMTGVATMTGFITCEGLN